MTNEARRSAVAVIRRGLAALDRYTGTADTPDEVNAAAAEMQKFLELADAATTELASLLDLGDIVTAIGARDELQWGPALARERKRADDAEARVRRECVEFLRERAQHVSKPMNLGMLHAANQIDTAMPR